MDRLDALIAELREFVRERDWEQFHDPKNLAMAVAAEAGELVAELRWVPGPETDAHCRDPDHREAIADEAADVAITLLMFADRVGLDLVAEARRKLDKQRRKYPADRVRGRWKPDR